MQSWVVGTIAAYRRFPTFCFCTLQAIHFLNPDDTNEDFRGNNRGTQDALTTHLPANDHTTDAPSALHPGAGLTDRYVVGS
jgi:hypothetical protein